MTHAIVLVLQKADAKGKCLGKWEVLQEAHGDVRQGKEEG